MKQGFVKVASATPRIRVADPVYNAQVICEQAKEAAEHGAKIVVFPELCITGYTCGDLFTQDLLLENAKKGLQKIATKSKRSITYDCRRDRTVGNVISGGTSRGQGRPSVQCGCGVVPG